MQLNTAEELVEDIRQGRMIILMDDEDRENEGDLIVAAEKITPEIINFMCTHARGLICLPLTGERCDQLGLPQMTANNQEAQSTAFTVSIEAAEGVTTGISAADRARTVQVASDPRSTKVDIVQPGHIFPLRAMPGGVLQRAGHTEAGTDLARLAGCEPAAVIVEIMNEDGTMARRPDLERFAETHGIKIGTIADLIHYRILNEKTVERENVGELPTVYGNFRMTEYRDVMTGRTHLALVMGQPQPEKPTLVRVHQAETFRDLLGACKTDSTSWPLPAAMARIAKEGEGVLVLLDADEYEPLGDSMKRFHEQDRQHHTTGAHAGVYMTIGTGSQILRDLGVGKMRLLSSPLKFSAISGFDLEVTENIPCQQP
ncbi:bifunctional 3,4-dihydroxy-2-butanone-4-phosphate synthase/GTP cyclohydrolase II [Sansalvadorimonas sp. 2012CJ34-2]|uniref:3,4-dihydroxy-2-butanone 4-phosphate synthase n=1 Tax=Parendozoicomonas callyspongiae TaxID=2942213 RepID=A0ABT0PGH5_9GAMM|nr:bifunctional 3,4-dihydroxy-2-butanone-4-phosphate synthase/GTP cyclohydrolase II [Sansalvadorimonas sp. 2012CJ34-2]MCL6270474.1 bifunctional 3,4-dihydroxy-2-butanone-4-phosphate synthase/GTP cyclohydrolase II [Sansalvadorimonas sp. 2012CJ34-2]